MTKMAMLYVLKEKLQKDELNIKTFIMIRSKTCHNLCNLVDIKYSKQKLKVQ